MHRTCPSQRLEHVPQTISEQLFAAWQDAFILLLENTIAMKGCTWSAMCR